MSKFATVFLSAVLGLGLTAANAADKINVFAAASIAPSIQKAAALYTAAKGTEIAVTAAASGPLAKQIEAGAPADIFVTADLKWMSWANDKGLMKADTIYNLAGNKLVLVASKDSAVTVDLSDKTSLGKALGDEKLAVGEPKSVPAGAYAVDALTALGLIDSAKPHFAEAESVRVALQLVARGEAALGIVYETDAKAEPGVKIVAVFPEETHKPVVYPIGVTKTGSAAGADFATWLKSEPAQAILTAAGFTKTVE